MGDGERVRTVVRFKLADVQAFIEHGRLKASLDAIAGVIRRK